MFVILIDKLEIKTNNLGLEDSGPICLQKLVDKIKISFREEKLQMVTSKERDTADTTCQGLNSRTQMRELQDSFFYSRFPF